ncbi:MAG: iron ABC transporter permease [Planctomycetota bacterium]
MNLSVLRPGPWPLIALAVSLLVVVPLATVVFASLGDAQGSWAHLAQTRLGTYTRNTLTLAAAVCAATAVIGTATAWVVTTCQFPGRRLFAWALLLPLTVPAYLAAYAYTDLLEPGGQLDAALRAQTGWSTLDLPPARSLAGAAFVLSITLYPYVYLAARASFAEQSGAAIEVSRTLGRGPWASFFRVALPMARPSIAAGAALVLMETLGDFGAVEHCAVDTFATGVFHAWRSLESATTAARLATVLITFVAFAVLLEGITRRRARFYQLGTRLPPVRRTTLRPAAAVAAIVGCALPVAMGFALPVAAFARLAWSAVESHAVQIAIEAGLRSASVAAVAAAIAVVLALAVRFARRFAPGPATATPAAACRLGYAIPGTVVGLGLLIPLAAMDRGFNGLTLWAFDWRPGLILTGTAAAVVIGYQTRFLAVATALLDGAFKRLRPSLDEAARTLGSSRLEMIRRVHLPLLRGSVAAAALLVFVDVVKELPATLMLRPFNFDTLAVRVYQLAGDERLPEASAAALVIIAIGVIPVATLSRLTQPSSARTKSLQPQ